MKLVMIEWIDSCTITGWHRLNTGMDCVSNCIAIGLMCHEDNKQIVITYAKSDSGHIAETLTIPKSCIKRIRYLKVK